MRKYLQYLLVGLTGAVIGLIVVAARWRTDRGVNAHDMTRRDIAELEGALNFFQQEFGVDYVPSQIKLSERCNYPQRDRPGTLDADSVRYLKKLWPRLRLSPGTEVDWNGDGRVEGDWVLEGDECLVFFVGGMPLKGKECGVVTGFSQHGRTPAVPGGMRRGPFFEFRSNRLRDLHGRGFFSYLDPYGKQPYAYFSAYGKANGYNRYGGTDCPTLKVWPYAETLAPEPRFVNPNSCQILSAGRDGKFGPGTDCEAHTWSPATASSTPPPGQDDLSNFFRKRLGGR
jgi:hypothetical protein